jgi:hypothetical protein
MIITQVSRRLICFTLYAIAIPAITIIALSRIRRAMRASYELAMHFYVGGFAITVC